MPVPQDRLASSLALVIALVIAAAGQAQTPIPRGTPTTTRGPAQAERTEPTKADYDAHIAALRKRLPGEGFHIVVQRPFVVVGDESAASVKRWATGTIKWAVDQIKRDYFAKNPDHIIDVWLFKNRGSYYKNAKKLFGSRPTTPFGYYLPGQRALVMNISTGGGTLVHEIVHPFMSANFPKCPAWFNEGLASLYEQSSEGRTGALKGHIIGLTNWRLAGLQKAIKAKRVPTFAELTKTTDRQFYADAKGTNYAQARYLCYYLQQQGLLRRFYRDFTANHAVDPTGLETLQRLLGTTDMAAFQRRWDTFVLGLRFSG